MLVLRAAFRLKPEHRDAALEAACAMLAPSQAEEGCITYNFWEDPNEANSFIFFEEWESRAHLDAHFETNHFKNFVELYEGYLSEPFQVRAYEVSSWNDL